MKHLALWVTPSLVSPPQLHFCSTLSRHSALQVRGKLSVVSLLPQQERLEQGSEVAPRKECLRALLTGRIRRRWSCKSALLFALLPMLVSRTFWKSYSVPFIWSCRRLSWFTLVMNSVLHHHWLREYLSNEDILPAHALAVQMAELWKRGYTWNFFWRARTESNGIENRMWILAFSLL